MKTRKMPLPLALALGAALAPFAVMAQTAPEPPVDPATPADTAPPASTSNLDDPIDRNVPVDPRDVRDPVDPAHPWTPPEQSQDPIADAPPAPVSTGDPEPDPAHAITGDAVRRGAQDQAVTIRSHEPDSVVGQYQVDFDTLDTSADGVIDRNEAMVNEELTAEFHVADSDGDGRLTVEELSGWMR